MNTKWDDVAEIVRRMQLDCRVKLRGEKPFEWSRSPFIPAPGCIETPAMGPVSLADVEWMQINPTKLVQVGRLLPVERLDVLAALSQELESHGISFVLEAGVVQVANL